ncbi:MAG TPA: aldehyde dehydrogenase family protein [Mycobacterium sp.]
MTRTALVMPSTAPDAPGTVEVFNPAHRHEVVGAYPLIDIEHVDAAVEAARASQHEWGRLAAQERHRLLVASSDAISALEGLDELLVREQGKILPEANFELNFYDATVAALGEFVDRLDNPQVLIDDGMGSARMYHKPTGVVGVIAPNNYPYAIAAIKLLPALLAGNAVVVVVAPTAPLTALRALRELASALPAGVLSVLTGPGPKVGQRLVEHPDVQMITFTGSTATGRLVAGGAADSLKRVVLELGGNDPGIVLDDCVVSERFIDDIVSGAYMTTGQVCFAIKRLYAPHALVDDITEAIAAALDNYVIGDGLDPGSSMGPMHSEAGRHKVRSLVEQARAGGATVRECGRLAADPDEGWYVRPSVVSSLDNAAALVQQEQFGPSLPVIGYDDIDHAVAMANDSEFGLCSSVWTADEERASMVARRLEAGTTFINSHGLFSIDPRAPFGGIKSSGVGRELGWLGLSAFCEPHVISTRHL